MRKKRFVCIFIFLGLCLTTTVTYWYKFVGLKDWSNTPDVNLRVGQISYDQGKGKERILADISFINKWLWYSLGFICFGFMVYNGFKLVAARGDADTFKKTTKGLIGAVVGIVICFLSYGIVKIIINLLEAKSLWT